MNILGFAIKPDPEPKEALEHLQLTTEEIEHYRIEDAIQAWKEQHPNTTGNEMIDNPYYNPPDKETPKPTYRTQGTVNPVLEQMAKNSYRWYR